MSNHLVAKKSVRMMCTLLVGAVWSGVALAADPALVVIASDTELKWGGCPAFMPKGCELAVLHGDPAKENTDVFLKIPGKSTVPMHIHTSAERMMLTAGELHLTYEGQPMSVLKAGSYAYGPAKRPHKAVCVSAKPCILFIAFEQPVDAIAVDAK
ncbi:cupin domain-containing protein [Massilia sp. TWR1-2-2]|uniref:cupin domain-containing protein n=1 Tax=Massilia sp. TWR1-2-2 TaxID=2804584 RepID=UPI003CF1C72A